MTARRFTMAVQPYVRTTLVSILALAFLPAFAHASSRRETPASVASSTLHVRLHKVRISAGASVQAITKGASGNLWALGAQASRPTIWELGSAGQVRATYPVPAGPASIVYGAVGPDGTLWFLAESPGSGRSLSNGSIVYLGHVMASGPVSLVTLLASDNTPLHLRDFISGFTVAPDGSVWFTAHARVSTNGVDRIDPTTGVTTTYSVPLESLLGGILATPDGNLWYAPSHPSAALTEIMPNGAFIKRVPLPGRAQETSEPIAGLGSSIWLGARGYIARVTDGAVKTFRLPYGGIETVSTLATGTGNTAVWFDVAGTSLGRISKSGAISQASFGFKEYTPPGTGPQLVAQGRALWFVGPHATLYEAISA